MKKEKKKITCPECGKHYEITLEPGKRYTDVECECGAIIPLQNPETEIQRVHVVKLELPRVTFRWALNTTWEFLLASFALSPVIFVLFCIIAILFRALHIL